MDVTFETILSAIGTVGFPIVVCGAMFWLYNKVLNELKTTVAENTKAILMLTARITGGDNK